MPQQGSLQHLAGYGTKVHSWCAGCKVDRDPAMSAPPSDLLALVASTTSSGFADGLGRRTLAFDREEGTMLERLLVRPELAAFEKMLRERVDRVAALEDERIARPRTVERDVDGGLVVVSEFVPGSRLSDLLDISFELGTAPGLDAAFGYLLDVLPALCGLHGGAGFAHGTISPSRTVLTPAGQVVLLDAVYGGALSHLRYGRRKLWTDFGVVAPSSAGAPRLGVEADVTQVVLAGVMLVLGRPLRIDEYPQGLSNVVLEVVDVAQIRGSAAFADRVLDFLQRALPVPGSRPYTSADDALIELRDLASELGLHACRRALVDFIEQMEPSGAQSPVLPVDDVVGDIAGYGLDDELRQDVVERRVDAEIGQDLDSGVDAEINLEGLVEEPLYDLDEITEIEISAEHSSLDDPLLISWSEEPAAQQPVGSRWDEAAAPLAQVPFARQPPEPPAVDRHVSPEVHVPGAPERIGEIATEVVAASTQAAIPVGAPASAELDAPAGEIDEAPSVRSRRAKRTRSTRSRKDKLRSAASPSASTAPLMPAIEPKVEAPAAPAKKSWLVPPDRSAAFEPAVPFASQTLPVTPFAPPIAAAPARAPAPVTPVFAAPPAAPSAQVYAPPGATAAPRAAESFVRPIAPPISIHVPAPYPAPVAWQPPGADSPAFSRPELIPQSAPLKLRELTRKPSGNRAPVMAPELFGAPAPPVTDQSQTSAFPWKLVAAAGVVMAMGIVGGRAYLPTSKTSAEASATSAPATPSSAVSKIELPATTGNKGRLEIETQPAGAKVLLDGKPAGQSPLTIDGVSAGRHTVTFVSASGSVKRTIRVEAGRTVKLDVPIFSGWVGIFAPFVVEVAEAGHVIGTTEEPRLMLSPGRHVLTLTNRDLGYSSVQTVDVEPGEVRSVSLDPRGSVNLNAAPWAEVWLDGRKLGDTPIANLEMPLGTRELIFRHSLFGERRVAVTVRGNAPTAISVDMSKP